MIYLEEQLQFLSKLHVIRGPIGDTILRILNGFDTTDFMVGWVAFIWIGFSWKWGARLGLLMTVDVLWIHTAKYWFASPRPYYFQPGIELVHVGGFGFPSGGAQTALLLGLLLIYYGKKPWIKWFGGFYALIISCSRMALGVHFPIDVLGGWIGGVALFYAFIRLRDPIERLAKKKSLEMTLSILVISILGMVFVPLKIKYMFVLPFVTVLGLFLSNKFRLYLAPLEGLWKKVALGVFGVASTAAIGAVFYLTPLPSTERFLVQTCVMGLWVSC